MCCRGQPHSAGLSAAPATVTIAVQRKPCWLLRVIHCQATRPRQPQAERLRVTTHTHARAEDELRSEQNQEDDVLYSMSIMHHIMSSLHYHTVTTDDVSLALGGHPLCFHRNLFPSPTHGLHATLLNLADGKPDSCVAHVCQLNAAYGQAMRRGTAGAQGAGSGCSTQYLLRKHS